MIRDNKKLNFYRVPKRDIFPQDSGIDPMILLFDKKLFHNYD